MIVDRDMLLFGGIEGADHRIKGSFSWIQSERVSFITLSNEKKPVFEKSPIKETIFCKRDQILYSTVIHLSLYIIVSLSLYIIIHLSLYIIIWGGYD